MNIEFSAIKLKAYVERLEQLDEQKTHLNQLVTDVFKEAESNGFIVKILRELLKQRKMEIDAVKHYEDVLYLYKKALDWK